MANIRGTLIGIDTGTLQNIITSATQCLIANTVRGTSYSIAGRNFEFPDLDSAQTLLQEANFALGLAQGTRSLSVGANFNPALGQGSSGGTGYDYSRTDF
jgi:hypothetical protein